tara:strand:- start:19835 stop:20212 length:378 start_codon:yes stop_codon:yes gene_type:complete
MTNGEDLVCSVDNMPAAEDESVQIKFPFALKIQKEHGFYEYSAYRWDMFLKDTADSVYWIPKKHIMLFGHASDNLVEMYTEWTNEEDETREDETREDETREDETREYTSKEELLLLKNYDTKKVH